MGKVNYEKLLTIGLLLVLIGVNMPDISPKSFYQSLGSSVWAFPIGLLLSFIITGVFMFFYNIFKPDNKFEITLSKRVKIGLVTAILYSLLTL